MQIGRDREVVAIVLAGGDLQEMGKRLSLGRVLCTEGLGPLPE